MKILMVTSRLPDGRQSLDMAPLARQIESLRAIGADVDVLEVKGDRGDRGMKYLRAIPRLRSMARYADVVHGHYAFCGWLASLAPQTPAVCSFMGDDVLGTPDSDGEIGWKSRLIVRGSKRLAQRLDAVIVKSPEMAEILAPAKCHVVPNGVDMERFTPIDKSDACQQLGWDNSVTRVLFPGNPDNPRKGFKLANAALDLAQQQLGKPLEMVVLWKVAPAEVPIYMNACDAMFMTSLLEGSPNVVKEAMACNLPVAAVPVGDVEILLDGVDGYSVSPRDPNALAEALVQMLAHTEPVDGRGALRRKKLDLPSVARRLLDIYASVLPAEVSNHLLSESQ